MKQNLVHGESRTGGSVLTPTGFANRFSRDSGPKLVLKDFVHPLSLGRAFHLPPPGGLSFCHSRLAMKTDRWLHIIPVALIMYTISYIDRTNVALALDPKISTMMKDLVMD